LNNFENSSAGATGLLRMAQCDYNAGRDADALQGYSAVISQYPHTMSAKEAKRGMELALYRLGQEDSGSEVLTELIEKYPDSSFAADAQFQIASGLYEKEKYAEAGEAFRKVVSRFPSFDEVDRAQFLSGEAWAKAGQTEHSIQAYQQFLLFFPESELRSTVQFRLGLQLYQKQDYMEAAVKFTAVVDQTKDKELQRAGLFNLAMAQQLLGKLADARASLERYRSEYPKDERSVEVALQLGKLHESTGEWEAAAKEYEAALNTGVGKDAITEVLYRLGQCREKLTEPDKALAAYKRSMKTGRAKDSYRLSAIARCAEIYEDRQDYSSAVAAYRDLIQNADDPELVAVAQSRVEELKSVIH
jgi:TolA-binding protein